MRLNKKDKEFFNSMEEGLKRELDYLTKNWSDSYKIHFIKGQLDMLKKIKDLNEDNKRLNIKY